MEKSFDTKSKYFQTQPISKPLLPKIAQMRKKEAAFTVLFFSLIFDQIRNYYLMILLLKVITKVRARYVQNTKHICFSNTIWWSREAEEEESMESIVLRIPGNCRKLSEPRVSEAADHSLCPGTSLLFLRHRYHEQQTGQQQMGTSQMVSPGLIPVPVCKTGCVDDLNLGKEKENHHTIRELSFLCLGSSPSKRTHLYLL